MRKTLVISILTFSLFSCGSKFSGYIEVEEDVFIKLISFEDIEKPFKDARCLSAEILIADEEAVLYRQYEEELVALEDFKLSFLLENLNEGDSALFKVASSRIEDCVSPLKCRAINSDFVDVIVKVGRYYDEDEYLKVKNEEDLEMLEQIVLNKYLKKSDVVSDGGIYKEVMIEGDGEVVNKGDEITIGYRGYFLNQLEFDEISGSTAFSFKYGTQGQVIKGLEIAIKSMREGEKSKIIIPSQLAFGGDGSTTLIVPSFTTVIYELEILKIK